MASGKLYLIPCPIADGKVSTIPTATIQCLHGLDHFIVERVRTARRFISASEPVIPIDEMVFEEMDKHNAIPKTNILIEWLSNGKNVGILSESGTPCIADPGAAYVYAAQQLGVQVIPLVGPSSILLALMASGLDGQRFAFNGYLPIKDNPLKQEIVAMQKTILKTGQTQIFIETPYRNDKLFKQLTNTLNDDLAVCIAINLTGKDETILTKTVAQWKKAPILIGKRNAIFILGNPRIAKVHVGTGTR